MPLDGHDFLVSQGWSGKGTGLRQGAISRPLTIPQKKNLAGLGKDRDEAFPFWDHLFDAAAKSIQLKFASDDESDQDSSLPEIKRTTTGIMSNRRPVTGVSATSSGTNTPELSDDKPRLNLLATAKRDAARSSLYARFFRGPILGPDDALPSLPETSISEEVTQEQAIKKPIEIKDRERRNSTDVQDRAKLSLKKRKKDSEDDAMRSQFNVKKEQKAQEKEERRARRRERKAEKEAAQDLEKGEKKKRKRELREKAKEVVSQDISTSKNEKGRKEKKLKNDVVAGAILHEELAPKDIECIPTNKVSDTSILTAEQTPSTEQFASETHERRKKKRRKQE